MNQVTSHSASLSEPTLPRDLTKPELEGALNMSMRSLEGLQHFRPLFVPGNALYEFSTTGGHMNPTSKLTKSEFAQRLGISPRQVDVLVARNALPPGSRSGRHLYWVEAVAAGWEARQFADQVAWAGAVTA